jgi:protein TonB
LTAEKTSSSGAQFQPSQPTVVSTKPAATNAVEQSQATASPTPQGKPGDKKLTNPAVIEQGEDEPPPPKPTPTPAPKPREPISGGVLDSKAISKPLPAYPLLASIEKVGGTVTVQVIVDESGKVVSARAVDGHPLLQEAAVEAAYRARFSPTFSSGQPVKVSGVLTYSFISELKGR